MFFYAMPYHSVLVPNQFFVMPNLILIQIVILILLLGNFFSISIFCDSVLLYSILFYSMPFYSILLYSILILSCSYSNQHYHSNSQFQPRSFSDSE